MVAAAHPPEGDLRTIAIASSARNPLAIGELADQIRRYFLGHPLPGKDGKPIKIGRLEFVDRRVALRKTVRRERLAAGLARVAMSSPVRLPQERMLRGNRTLAERVTRMVKIYGAYTELDCVFDDANAHALSLSLPRGRPRRAALRHGGDRLGRLPAGDPPAAGAQARHRRWLERRSSPERRAGSAPPTARALAADGLEVVLGARRLDRLTALAEEIGGGARAIALDVTDPDSVTAFAAELERCDVLVNNAGGALGLDHVAEADEEQWRQMYEANVMGTMRMTRALLPALIASGDGHVVTVTSIAGFEAYRGGGGYMAAKHAQRAMLRALRLELLGEPVRVTEVAPGMVETEFSVVRFGGDEEAASRVYEGMQPLERRGRRRVHPLGRLAPSHVNVDEIVVRPRAQASATEVHRRK